MKFKTRSAYSLRKRGPSGRIYVFTRTTVVEPDTKEDENWMISLCSKEGGALLISNEIEGDSGAVVAHSRMTMKDLVPDFVKKEPVPINPIKTNEQKEAELNLAKEEEAGVRTSEDDDSPVVIKEFRAFLKDLSGKGRVDDIPEKLKDAFSKKDLLAIADGIGLPNVVDGSKLEISEAIISYSFLTR